MINARRALDPQLMGSGQMMPQQAQQQSSGMFGGGLSRLGGGLKRFQEFAQANPAAMAALGSGIMSGNTALGFSQFGQLAQAGGRKKGIAKWVKSIRPDLAELAETNPDAALKIALSKGSVNKPQIQTFYDDKGLAYKAQYNTQTGEWDKVGGSKLPTSMKIISDGKGGFTFQQGELSPDKLKEQSNARTVKSDVIITAAKEARALINGSTTGTPGKLASNIFSESEAAELRRQAAVLKSNATIENLQAMRRGSPTGGALGNVSDAEGAMLAAAAGALDPDSGPEQFRKQLDNYERTLLRVVHGPEAGDVLFNQMQTQRQQQEQLGGNPNVNDALKRWGNTGG